MSGDTFLTKSIPYYDDDLNNDDDDDDDDDDLYFAFLDLRVPSMHRGRANMICVLNILAGDPRRR